MGVRINIKGKFPKQKGPFVIMSNHGSFIDVFVVPLQTLRVVSLLLPQYSSRAPHRHFPWFTPAVNSQRGSHAGQSEFALHASQVGYLALLMVSHLGVGEPGASQA